MHHIIVDPDDRILDDPQRTWALLRLCLQADDNGNVFCSLQQLATDWGVSRYTVLRVTRELEAGGWVRIERHQGRMTVYRVMGRGMQLVANLPPVAKLPLVANLQPVSDNTVSVSTTSTKPKKVKPPPSDASRLVHQHADQYTKRFGRPFPVAWARDTQIVKRLIGVYGVSQVEQLQMQYLSQPLDSFAAKRGYSIPQFAAEIAGLAAQDAVRAQMTAEQIALLQEMQETVEGFSVETALTLIAEHPLTVIRDQLQVYRWRQQQGQPVSPGRLERAIRERWAIPDGARPAVYTPYPFNSTGKSRSNEDAENSTVNAEIRNKIEKMMRQKTLALPH